MVWTLHTFCPPFKAQHKLRLHQSAGRGRREETEDVMKCGGGQQRAWRVQTTVLTSEYSDRQNFAVSEDTNNKRDREIDKERKNESETERNNENFYEIVVLIFLQFWPSG